MGRDKVEHLIELLKTEKGKFLRITHQGSITNGPLVAERSVASKVVENRQQLAKLNHTAQRLWFVLS